MDFSNVKKWYIPHNGTMKAVSEVHGPDGTILWKGTKKPTTRYTFWFSMDSDEVLEDSNREEDSYIELDSINHMHWHGFGYRRWVDGTPTKVIYHNTLNYDYDMQVKVVIDGYVVYDQMTENTTEVSVDLTNMLDYSRYTAYEMKIIWHGYGDYELNIISHETIPDDPN